MVGGKCAFLRAKRLREVQQMESYKLNLRKAKSNARENLKDGAVTELYGMDREKMIELLNSSLATEIVCVLRYRYHYQAALAGKGLPIAREFWEHSNQELAHADKLAERISQLGGTPNYNPEGLLDRSHTGYTGYPRAEAGLMQLMEDDLVAERIAIEAYTQMIRFIDNKDPTTRRILEAILAEEEHHADELSSAMEWCQAIGYPKNI